MTQAAVPHGAGDGPGEKEPAGLDGERLPKLYSFQALEKDRDRTEQFVIKRHPFQRRLDPGRHDVDREHLAAQEIFERVNNENDGGDFQDPERHHRERIGDKELDERRHQHRQRREHVSHRVVRERDVVVEIEKNHRDRRQRDEGVNKPATAKNTEPVGEITHRLSQERVDLTFANIGGDLPFVFGRRDQIADQDREQIIIDHRAVVVAVESAASLFENRAPQKNRTGERDQSERRAQKIIPAINERVLEPDVEDGNVLVDPARAHAVTVIVVEKKARQKRQRARNCGRILLLLYLALFRVFGG